MKLLVLAAFLFAGCGVSKTSNPVQVQRSVLTIDRIQSQYRYPQLVYYVIWVDSHGIEYREKLNNVEDTAHMKRGLSLAQLLKR